MVDLLPWLLTPVALAGGYLLWRVLVGRKQTETPPLPYKVIKAPASEGGRKVVAVLGGTGFIGSHVVDELVSRDEVDVHVLGRRFKEGMVNPNAASLVQVDMRDLQSLTTAFQGVDSVISMAASIPSAYATADSIRGANKVGYENTLKAVQAAGVKNFVWISALRIKGMPTESTSRAYGEEMYHMEEVVLEANGKEGLRTCVVAPCWVIGLRMGTWKKAIEGKSNSIPMLEHPMSFVPAEHVAVAIANAESKLSSEAEGVVGKRLPIVGEVLSMREFASLPTWPHKFTHTPMAVLRVLAWINAFLARNFGWAPLGDDISPGMASVLTMAPDEDEETTSTVYRVLDLPPPPSMKDYIQEMAEKAGQRQAT